MTMPSNPHGDDAARDSGDGGEGEGRTAAATAARDEPALPLLSLLASLPLPAAASVASSSTPDREVAVAAAATTSGDGRDSGRAAALSLGGAPLTRAEVAQLVGRSERTIRRYSTPPARAGKGTGTAAGAGGAAGEGEGDYLRPLDRQRHKQELLFSPAEVERYFAAHPDKMSAERRAQLAASRALVKGETMLERGQRAEVRQALASGVPPQTVLARSGMSREAFEAELRDLVSLGGVYVVLPQESAALVELLGRHDIASPLSRPGGLHDTVRELLELSLRFKAERDAARDKLQGLEQTLEQEREDGRARLEAQAERARVLLSAQKQRHDEANVRSRGEVFRLRAHLLHTLDRLARYAPPRALTLHWRSMQTFSEAHYVEDARAGEEEGWRTVCQREGLPQSAVAWWQAWAEETDKRTGAPHGHPGSWRFATDSTWDGSGDSVEGPLPRPGAGRGAASDRQAGREAGSDGEEPSK